jgi:hypothetical protein
LRIDSDHRIQVAFPQYLTTKFFVAFHSFPASLRRFTDAAVIASVGRAVGDYPQAVADY